MAELRDILVPDIGDFDGVEVVEVLVSPGDHVTAEDSLITLESDKASMEVPASSPGRIAEVLVAVGDPVAEGTIIVRLEPEGDTDAAEAVAHAREPAAPEPESTAPTPPPRIPDLEPVEPAAPEPEAIAPAAPPRTPPPPVAVSPPPAPGAPPHTSPSVRKLARELGVDLAGVTGTGRKGRINRRDVESAARGESAGPGGGSALPPMPAIDFAQFGQVDTEPLTRINKLTGQSVHRSWLHVPHVTQFDQADITEMEAFRKAKKPEAEARGTKLTFLSFLLAATAATLREFPRFNSSLDASGDNLVIKAYVHIGIAVDTPKGLVVPVIRDVDTKRVYELAAELSDISARAREGKLTPSDLQGGTFTISSLGGIGGTAFTPIVNAPEVAILGVSRAAMQPVWNGSEFEPRLMLPLSLSYDHRVVDGAAAARFTTHLGRMLSDIRNLLL